MYSYIVSGIVFLLGLFFGFRSKKPESSIKAENEKDKAVLDSKLENLESKLKEEKELLEKQKKETLSAEELAKYFKNF